MAPVTGASHWSKLTTGIENAVTNSSGISIVSIGTSPSLSRSSFVVLLGTERKALNGAAMFGRLNTLIGD